MAGNLYHTSSQHNINSQCHECRRVIQCTYTDNFSFLGVLTIGLQGVGFPGLFGSIWNAIQSMYVSHS